MSSAGATPHLGRRRNGGHTVTGGQLLQAMRAVADFQVRLDVSVEVTAHASASAGAP